MDILDLPTDIFQLVLKFLSSRDLISVRRVSKKFFTAFTDLDLNHHFLTQRFPKSREARSAIEQDLKFHQEKDWSRIFHQVASRYYNLSTASPRSIEKFPLAKSAVLPEWCKFYPVAPWQRHLHFENRFTPFHYSDTLWTYDDGLLIFPSTALQHYVLLDLETKKFTRINIGSPEKIVRRIRLRDGVLIVEWCEQQPFHQLNESETVYRHFASAFDVIQDSTSQVWTVRFRNEWKIHFLGMPLNSRDRFFSVHNRNHYALYLWQPNRSAWGEDEPIESLTIWDITSSSSYHPSKDPTGKYRPTESETGPEVIKRLSFTDLDFYSIRQRDTPVLQRLEVDAQHVYIIEENHRWMSGDQATFNVPRLHEVKCVGIPFHAGPRWESSCGVDGDGDMSFCQSTSRIRELHLAPCWRHEEFPYLTVAEVADTRAGITFSARQCFTVEALNIKSDIEHSEASIDASLGDELWPQLMDKGKISGNERWLIGENWRNEVVIIYF